MNSIDIVHRFWETVWQHPYDVEAIDDFVVQDFRITSGGEEIVSRDAFKDWVNEFRSKILDLHLEPIESFQNHDGTRVASRWVVTGRNNGLMGTKPDRAPIRMTGTAVWAVREDGKLLQNWVERSAWEVYRSLTAGGA
jgi:SnoaL-like polyketide cyclase